MRNYVVISLLLFAQSSWSQELEKKYWDCDYMATSMLVDPVEAAECSQVSEQLLKDKFKGNFKDFMAWWRGNKEVEHSKRQRVQR